MIITKKITFNFFYYEKKYVSFEYLIFKFNILKNIYQIYTHKIPN